MKSDTFNKKKLERIKVIVKDAEANVASIKHSITSVEIMAKELDKELHPLIKRIKKSTDTISKWDFVEKCIKRTELIDEMATLQKKLSHAEWVAHNMRLDKYKYEKAVEHDALSYYSQHACHAKDKHDADILSEYCITICGIDS